MTSRKKFERWCAKNGVVPTSEVGVVAWDAWQASRSTVSIKLPKPAPPGDYRMLGPFYGADGVITAIEAAGVKVKS